MLQRQSAELALADGVDPLVREEGLLAIAKAMAAAKKVADHVASITGDGETSTQLPDTGFSGE